MPQLNCFNITYDIHVMCNIFSFLNSDHRCITNSINSRSEKYPSTNADVANLHPMFRLKYFLSECTFRISPHLCDTQRETLPYEYVCTHTYFRAQVISTRIAFAIYGHTEIRVCSFRVRAHVYAPLESASRLDYIYNLLAVYRWRIRVTVWVCVLAECLRNDGCVCVRARVMCVRAERVAGVFCYIDRAWSTTSPSPIRSAPISPHPVLYRAPAPHAHPTFSLPSLVLVFHSTSPIRKPSTLRQPPVTRIFACWCSHGMIYELSQICIRVTWPLCERHSATFGFPSL